MQKLGHEKCLNVRFTYPKNKGKGTGGGKKPGHVKSCRKIMLPLSLSLSLFLSVSVELSAQKTERLKVRNGRLRQESVPPGKTTTPFHPFMFAEEICFPALRLRRRNFQRSGDLSLRSSDAISRSPLRVSLLRAR